MNFWQERETCFVSTHPQGSDEWKNLRIGSVTMSGISSYIGTSQYSLTPDVSAQIICGIHEKSFDQNSINRMEIGISGEPILRNWYSEQLKKYCIKNNLEIPIVTEIGIAVWKKNPIFRGSVDGEVGNEGCVEFKIPKKIPYSLRSPSNDPSDFSHIPVSHFDQMQGNMHILGKKWCDYLVYSHFYHEVYYERIPYLESYCESLFSKAEEFYSTYVIPMMEENKIVRIDPPLE